MPWIAAVLLAWIAVDVVVVAVVVRLTAGRRAAQSHNTSARRSVRWRTR